jgi:hypothetical protein
MELKDIFIAIGIMWCCFYYCIIVICIICKTFGTTTTTTTTSKLILPYVQSGGNLVKLEKINENTYYYIFNDISGNNSMTFSNFDISNASIKIIVVGGGGGGTGAVNDNGVIKGFNGMGGNSEVAQFTKSKLILSKINITIGKGGKTGNNQTKGEKGGDTILKFIFSQPHLNIINAENIFKAEGGIGGVNNYIFEPAIDNSFGLSPISYSGNIKNNNNIYGSGGYANETMGVDGNNGCVIIKITYNLV